MAPESRSGEGSAPRQETGWAGPGGAHASPEAVREGPLSPHPFNTRYFLLFSSCNSHPNGREVVSHCSFDCISLRNCYVFIDWRATESFLCGEGVQHGLVVRGMGCGVLVP